MAVRKFEAALRSVLGNPNQHVTLEIQRDGDGFVIVIQEHTDAGNMRSQGVRVQNAAGDMLQHETHLFIESFIEHIHAMHKLYPTHPAYITEKV